MGKKKNKYKLVLDHDKWNEILNSERYQLFPEDLPNCVFKKVKKKK